MKDNDATVSEQKELCILQGANEELLPNKIVHYAADENRDYYALHYVTHGKGRIVYGNKEYSLKKGDMFLISPKSEITYFSVDSWNYYWVNVSGAKVQSLLDEVGFGEWFIQKNVDDAEIEQAFRNLTGAIPFSDSLTATGWFLVMLGRLRKLESRKFDGRRMYERHVNAAMQYIAYNYYYPDLTLDFLARNLAISKNYLCKIFHDSTGKTPIEYLIDLRMETARKRLTQSNDTVSEIAKTVGYRDPLYFSKEFRKKYGRSPVQYRKEFTEK